MKRRLIIENCCKDQFMEYNSNHRGVIHTRGAVYYQKCRIKSVLIYSYRASHCFITYTVNNGIIWCGVTMLNLLEKYRGHSPYNNFRCWRL